MTYIIIDRDSYSVICSQFDFFFFGNRLQSLVSIIDKVKGQMQLVMKSRPEGKGNQDEEDREEEEKET